MNAEAFDEEVFGFGVSCFAGHLLAFFGAFDEDFVGLDEVGDVVLAGEAAVHFLNFGE